MVDVQGGPVAAGRHLACRFRVDRIGIVKKSGGGECAQVNDGQRRNKVAQEKNFFEFGMGTGSQFRS